MLGELGLGVLEIAELLLPAVLQAARDEAVVRLAGVEGAFGADRLIPGALDAQLERAVRALAAVGVLVGGGQRERDLFGLKRLEQPAGDQLIDDGRLDRAAAGRVDVVGARVAAFVVAAFAAVKGVSQGLCKAGANGASCLQHNRRSHSSELALIRTAPAASRQASRRRPL